VPSISSTLPSATQDNITRLGTITVGVWTGTNIAVANGGTGASTLNDLITLATHTTGNYAATITGGTGIDSTGATSGENIAHSLSLDLNEITTETSIASGDYIAMVDITDDGSGKITFANLESTLNHDSLAGFASGEHFLQSAITTVGTVTTGTWDATDITVSGGGTGASTASGARTNLGLVIGTDVQAFSAVLDDFNTLGAAGSDGQFVVATGAGAFAYESGATARTSLGLGSLSALSTINDSNWSGTDLAVANGGTGASTASAARTNLGLGTADTPQFENLGLGGASAAGAGLDIRHSNLNNGTSQYGILSDARFGSGTTGDAYALAGRVRTAAASFTLGNAYGLNIFAPTVGSGSTITNNYGILVQDMTGGSTSDYGIAIAGADTAALWLSSAADNTDAANGIAFGLSKDTNLYRSGANTLKTDDAFAADSLTLANDLAVTHGGTGASTLNDLIALATHTTGNYAATITGGTGIDSTGATSGENIAHTLSIDLNEITTETSIASGDYIAMVDITDDGSGKITFANLESTLNHDSLAGTIICNIHHSDKVT